MAPTPSEKLPWRLLNFDRETLDDQRLSQDGPRNQAVVVHRRAPAAGRHAATSRPRRRSGRPHMERTGPPQRREAPRSASSYIQKHVWCDLDYASVCVITFCFCSVNACDFHSACGRMTETPEETVKRHRPPRPLQARSSAHGCQQHALWPCHATGKGVRRFSDWRPKT